MKVVYLKGEIDAVSIDEDVTKLSNDWAMVISGLVNKPANNTIWSVVQRLFLRAAIYFIWQEINIRRMEHRERIVDGLFKVFFDNVRLKLMGLKLKWTSDVIKASKIWNLPMKKDKDGKETYRIFRNDNSNE
ncbi:hypothetical protein Tco_0367388 [Tanacetum coccineum]